MLNARFRHSAGWITLQGLPVAWCPKYRKRVLGGRVALRLNEVLGGIAAPWQIVAREGVLWSKSYLAAPVRYVPEATVRSCIEHQWDQVA
jgi:putative transposase